MKNKIIEILELETFNTSDEAGNDYKVVEDCDFDEIAEKIVKLFAISVVSSSAFKVGDKVRTRGDIGGFKLTITAIHNDHYCTCKGYGKQRHFNISFLEHYC